MYAVGVLEQPCASEFQERTRMVWSELVCTLGVIHDPVTRASLKHNPSPGKGRLQLSLFSYPNSGTIRVRTSRDSLRCFASAFSARGDVIE